MGRELIQLVSKFRSDFLLVDVLIIKTIFYRYLFLSWAIVTICSIYIIRTVVLLIIAALMTFFFPLYARLSSDDNLWNFETNGAYYLVHVPCHFLYISVSVITIQYVDSTPFVSSGVARY